MVVPVATALGCQPVGGIRNPEEPMPSLFETNPVSLEYLLQRIHNRDTALPDFQRDFVWEPKATEELIESICRNFPAGSLLQIKNAEGFYFAPRAVEGAPELDGHNPEMLILDGQQRLTSLYQAFYGVGGHRYLINLQGLMAGEDLEDCVYYLRAPVAQKYRGTIAQQAADLVFPLERLFATAGGFDDWLDEVLEARPEQGDDRRELTKRLRAVKREWIDNILKYDFPVVTLSPNTSAEAVCTIFETLNRTGVKLSVFDLLAARFWPEDVRLRDLWDRARNAYPLLSEHEIDPYYLLQGVSIYTASGAPSCKRGDVLKMTVTQVTDGWEAVVRGLNTWLTILRTQCGVVLPKLMPYNPMLVPAMATLAAVENVTGAQVGAMHQKMQRWFWCSVFGQSYENSPNSQAVADYTDLVAWLTTPGATEPRSVAGFQFDPSSLRETTTRQRAVYRGVLALILQNGARDLHCGKVIDAALMRAEEVDDHHVFPAAWLDQQTPKVPGPLRDCVLNRTLLDKSTNIRIGKRAPSDYLGEVAQMLGADMDAVLSSHLLPVGAASPLMADQFGAFIDARQALLAQRITAVTS